MVYKHDTSKSICNYYGHENFLTTSGAPSRRTKIYLLNEIQTRRGKETRDLKFQDPTTLKPVLNFYMLTFPNHQIFLVVES